MYAKVFNLKFVKPTDAKVASSYFAENLAKFIRPCNMQSISISLGPCGSLTRTAKFDSGSDLKTFESRSKSVFDDIKTSFDFIQTNYSGDLFLLQARAIPAELAKTEIFPCLLHDANSCSAQELDCFYPKPMISSPTSWLRTENRS